MLKTKKKSLGIVFIVSLLILLISGCNTSSKTSSTENGNKAQDNQTANLTPKTGGTITVGVSEEPDTLDVQKTGMAVADTILANIGGGLVTQDPQTKEFKPYLAEKWDVSPDGKTWTFKIRQGIKFQDGTPLTSQSFKDSYERALNPATASKVTGGDLATIASIEAPDAQTLVLKLKQPFAPLLQYLSDPGYLQPLSMDAVKKEGAQYGRNPVGLGPWKFDSWTNGQQIVLDRNPDFNWAEPIFKNQGPVRPDKLVYKFITDSQTMLAALDSGSIDIASKIAAKDVQKYKNNPNFQIESMLRNGLGLFVMMNTQKTEFQDIRVRQAFNEAINKDAIVKAVLQGEGVVAHGPIPPTFFGYDKNVAKYDYRFDAKKAKKQLESAGYKLNSKGFYEKDGKELDINLLTMSGTWEQAAQLIQAMLKEIGVNVKVVTLEWGALVDTATKGNFDMTLMGYTYNDPDVLYLFLHSSQAGTGLNFGYVKDSKLDDLIVKGRTTIDPTQRADAYKELQKYIDEQAYWIPVYTEKQFNVIRKNVQGVTLHPLRGLQFQDSWVNK